MKKLLLATAAVAVGCFNPAHAGNTLDDHHDLWRAIENAGISVHTNHPKACEDAWGGGFYAQLKNGGAVMMICQNNGKSAGFDNQVQWTANDLDTLRHEAHHLVQDCLNGPRDGDLDPMFSNPDEHRQFVVSSLDQGKIEWIIEKYAKDGADRDTIILELEAFAVAEDVSASAIANGVRQTCSAPTFRF